MQFPDYYPPEAVRTPDEQELERTLDALLAAMTLEEKLDLFHGAPIDETRTVAEGGYNPGVPRLGVPELRMFDGPSGPTYKLDTTNLPAPVLLGSTFSEELAGQYGAVMGAENRAISGNHQLGCQYDTARIPHFDRTRDMLGEDPVLTSRLAIAQTRAVQAQGVVAVAKHIAAYAQSDVKSADTNVQVDEQTLQEMYLRPFKAALLQGGAGAVMSAYTMLNGSYMAANREILVDVLRKQWSYRGYVISDWGSLQGFSADKGLDMEMPVGAYSSNERLRLALKLGRLSQQDVDATARRVLYALGRAGYLGLVQVNADGTAAEQAGRSEPIRLVNRYEQAVANGLFERSADTAYRIAVKGAVLLKNENHALPVQPGEKVAMIGLGALHLLSGQRQERAFGRLDRMESPFSATRRLAEGRNEVRGTVGLDIVGTTIPGDCLFTSEQGEENGLLRSYGITARDGEDLNSFFALMAREAKKKVAEAPPPPPATDEEKLDAFEPMRIPVPEECDVVMEGHSLGEPAGVDRVVEFTTQSSGGINASHRNGPEGKAFPKGSAYTWKGWLEAPESGEFDLVLQCIGGVSVFKLEMDGERVQVGSTEMREGAHWPWSNVVCSADGLDLKSRRIHLEAGRRYPLTLTARALLADKDLQLRIAWITPTQRRQEREKALELARWADKTVLFVWKDGGAEGNSFKGNVDLVSLRLPEDQLSLLQDVRNATSENGKQLVVAANSGNAFVMGEWEADADAILNLWLPGQEGGRAAAALLLGEETPAGRLCQTLPARDEDSPVTDSEEHRRTRHDDLKQVDFSEGIFFGYRWYDRQGIEPLFCFGHGLSYTSFAYANATVEGAPGGPPSAVSLRVENTGALAGDEVVQVYLGAAEAPGHVQMAKRQLAGFLRVENLQPGESREVRVPLDADAFYYWDTRAALARHQDGTLGRWQLARGPRELYIGASSRDIRITKQVNI